MSPERLALVTGATGFVGDVLVEILLRKGWRVGACVRPGSRHRCPPGVDWIIEYDLGAKGELRLPPGVDTVFHLAGKTHDLAEVKPDPAEYTRINVEGTRHVLRAAERAGVRAFVYFSTVQAAGHVDPGTAGGPIDEAWEGQPETAFGRSKREAERLVLASSQLPHPVVIRPCLVYGKSAKGNFARMVRAVGNGLFPPIPMVENRRSMIHVEDLCRAAILSATYPQSRRKTYIVAENTPVSTRQLFEWMCAAAEREVPRWSLPLWSFRGLALLGDVIGRVRGRRAPFDSHALENITGDAWYSAERIESELSWRPRWTVREALPYLFSRPWRATVL